MEILFEGYRCSIEVGKFHGKGRMAIILVDTATRENVVVATVNFPEENMADDEVAIKKYDRKDTLLKLLLEHKVISPPHGYVKKVNGDFPVCRLIAAPASTSSKKP